LRQRPSQNFQSGYIRGQRCDASIGKLSDVSVRSIGSFYQQFLHLCLRSRRQGTSLILPVAHSELSGTPVSVFAHKIDYKQ
jgi:hypothetical protein